MAQTESAERGHIREHVAGIREQREGVGEQTAHSLDDHEARRESQHEPEPAGRPVAAHGRGDGAVSVLRPLLEPGLVVGVGVAVVRVGHGRVPAAAVPSRPTGMVQDWGANIAEPAWTLPGSR